MAAAAAAMNSGDPSALLALRARLQEVEAENARLRAQGGRRGRSQDAGEDEEEDEEERRDRDTFIQYDSARMAIMEAFDAKRAPTAEQ
jgi:hypothetical protein